jgi:hypothetical protein
MGAGRPALALATAQATGANIIHPERYRDAADLLTFALGPPTPWIVAQGLIEEWQFIVCAITWLTEADRALVEIACVYRANRRRLAAYRRPIVDDDLIVPAMLTDVQNLLLIPVDDKATGIELRILEKLGATPVSRPKVVPPGHKGGRVTRKKDGWW